MALWPSPPKLEDTSPLAANGVFDGQSYETTGFEYFRCLAASDQAGTISVQYSHDKTSWWPTISEPIESGTGTVLESMCCARYVRVSVTNGALPQNEFLVTSCMRGTTH